MNRVIVIGAGLSGLFAANQLQDEGASVTVLEANPTVGGRARTSLVDGVSLNFGAHALYNDGPADRGLKSLGIHAAGNRPKGKRFLLVGDDLVDMPSGPSGFFSSRFLTPSEKLDLANAFRHLLTQRIASWHHRSVHDCAYQMARTVPVQQLLLSLFRVATYANDPAAQSAGSALRQLRQAVVKEVRYLDGGWQQMVDALRTRAQHNGVRFVHARAQGLVFDGDTVTGVQADVLHPADAVALAIPKQQAIRLLAASNHAVPSTWAGGQPVFAACLDVALHRLPKPNQPFALGIEQPLYVSVHSQAAQLGGHVVHVMKYLDPHHPPATRDELEQALDVLQPGWRDVVAHARFLPKLMVCNNLDRADRGGASSRPDVTVNANLFVMGDWIGPEGLLADASIASARLACRAINASRRVAAA
jgi:phytoene dehydrogenase-like protein